MVQSRAATVAEYLVELPPARRAALEEFITRAARLLPGFSPEMRYGMPHLVQGDRAVAAASQVQYLAFYFDPGAMAAHRSALKNHDHGKACLRFRDPAAIDWPLVESLLRATAALR